MQQKKNQVNMFQLPPPYIMNYGSCLLREEVGYEHTKHTHNLLELSIVAEGSCKYAFENKVYDVQKNDIFVINNHEPHGIVLKENDCVKNLVIHFEPRFIWDNDSLFDARYLKIFFDRSRTFSHRLERNNPATIKIAKLFYEIEEEMTQKQSEYELMVKVKTMNILALLLRHYGYKKENYYPKKNLKIISEVTNFIHKNYDQEIKLQTLAAIACMNASYFSTFFKKFNGVSPSEYITRIRVGHAEELLREKEHSMLEIATLCGFNNSTNFNKMFKRITNRTPTEYKNSL